MTTFEINDTTRIVCEHVNTRTAFKHVAKLYVNRELQDETKICYEFIFDCFRADNNFKDN